MLYIYLLYIYLLYIYFHDLFKFKVVPVLVFLNLPSYLTAQVN